MIPKTIHYCWFGKNPKSPEIVRCIESWKRLCPTFKIKEWNESNFPIEQFPFTSRMYLEKRWAFVADYVRLYVLEQEGGIYLDTDMLLVQPLSSLLDKECVLGEESPGTISGGMIGAIAHHPYIIACKNYYDSHTGGLITVPRALTKIYNEYSHKESLHVYPPKAFYPFDSEHIHNYREQDLGPEVIGVHLWNYSWGHPLNKFFKRIGIYRIGKKVVEILGIKQILKKLLGFI